MEDIQIVALYFERDERALKETAEKYGGYCYRVAFNVLGNEEDSHESVNDTYLAAWNSMPPHKPSVLSAFLGKLTRRIAISRFRRQTAEKRGGGQYPLALEELAECIPSHQRVETELEGKQVVAALNRFLRSLPEQEQRVFVCRYWHLEPIAALAKRFGFSESKVKSMLMRTRQRLLTFLTEEGLYEKHRVIGLSGRN